MVSILSDWGVYFPYYFVKVLNRIQWFVDIILVSFIGYTTRRGWKKEEEEAKVTYGKCAQVVMKMCLSLTQARI